MALSSDAPVVMNFNPFKGMEAAVTRKDRKTGSIVRNKSGSNLCWRSTGLGTNINSPKAVI